MPPGKKSYLDNYLVLTSVDLGSNPAYGNIQASMKVSPDETM